MELQAKSEEENIDELLSGQRVLWLLGAGASLGANLPLMGALTQCVVHRIEEDETQALFNELRCDLPEEAHIEHILTYLGDLISLAGQHQKKLVSLRGETVSEDELKNLHGKIQQKIAEAIRWGYCSEESKGERLQSIVTIQPHLDFVDALFETRQKGKRGLNGRPLPPVDFFTVNYDTLLEDALALRRVLYHDGFVGGSMGFWAPDIAPLPEVRARVWKLHGSIDWFQSKEDLVIRRPPITTYCDEEVFPDSETYVIYPQATKYAASQRSPFAEIFRQFRDALCDSSCERTLAVNGYSFGDDHINREIEEALRRRDSRLTVLALVKEAGTGDGGTTGLSKTLSRWLMDDRIGRNVIAVSDRKLYRGPDECPIEKSCLSQLWKFSALTSFLKAGPEKLDV